MSTPTPPHIVRQRMPVIIKNAVQRRKELLLKGEETEANALANRGHTGGHSPHEDIFTSAPQIEFKCNPIGKERLSRRIQKQAIERYAKQLFTLPSPLRHSHTPNSFTRTPSPRHPHPPLSFRYSADLPRNTFTISPPLPFASQLDELQAQMPSPMQRRRGALPVGNNQPNSVSQQMTNYLNQQNSFGSTNSADSNESFRTQVALPYHLPQSYQTNNYAVNATGYAQTGSSGSLNPTSSPYIPQGNTPTLPSTGFGAQGWGAPQMATGGNGGMSSSYQQQQPGQQFGGMQYQGGNFYQPSDMQLGGAVGAMSSQFQNFNTGSGPYGHFGTAGDASSNSSQFHTSNSQIIGFPPYAAPDMGYGAAGQNQSFSLPYVAGIVNEPANQICNGRENIMYGKPSNGSSSFHSNQSTTYGAQMPGSSSFNSASTNAYGGQNSATSSFTSVPGSMYGNQNQGGNFKGMQHQKQSRPGSRNSNSSNTRFQKKSFASDGKERNSYRGNSNQRSSNSSTPTLGGPVQGPKGARVKSPEKEISKNGTSESSRTRKNTSIEDTSNVLTPVKPQAFDTEVASEQRRTEAKTPQLRSRRGQTIASVTEPMRKQSVSEWTVSVHKSSENGDITEEMKRRGSPVHAMSLMTLNESDPFTTSMIAAGPFDCITPGPFTKGVRVDVMSQELQGLTYGGTRNPTLQEAIDPYNIPFAEYCRLANPDNYGVIKIKNIPYGTHRAEVLAFLGRNARIVSESEYEPIHIIMERVTSKTLDCFVEFIDLGEAVSAVNRFESNRVGGRGRLGQRLVEVELSTQGALMKELFPKAKDVQWESGRPQIIPRDLDDPYNSGFQGFIIKEELIMLLKHVESPQRTPFSKDCPQRSFECLISTLVKYPWYMVDYITIEDRNLLHETTKRMLEILVDRVSNDEDKVNLNTMLLKRVWRAALQCPGFSPSMKDDIVYIAGLDDRTAVEFGLAPHASYWNKLWTLGPKPGVPVDVILWYAAKIRQACITTQQLSLAQQAEIGNKPKEFKLFGDLDDYIEYGKGLGQMTLAHVAKVEWAAIENALRRAFTQALPAPS